MKENKITLVIRIKGKYNDACRCINSVLRQTVDSYNLSAIVYGEELAEKLREAYENINFEVVSQNKEFKNFFNRIVSQANTKYCMIVNSDSILAVNAVERILKYDDDLVVFNIAKANGNDKFKTFYPASSYENTAAFLQQNLCVWTVAYKTDFIVKNNIKLKGVGYENQALFLLLCLSLSEKTAFCKDVFLYKWNIVKNQEISDIFYYKNKADIKRALNSFEVKGDNESKIQVVKVFLLASIYESYSRPFLRKMKKMISLVRLIWF